MKRVVVVVLATVACTDPGAEGLCATPTFGWTVQDDAVPVPPTASLGRVPDIPVWPVTRSEIEPSVDAGEYVATVDTSTGGITALEPGVVRVAGRARWFVPDAGALPAGDLLAELGGEHRQVVVDDTATLDAPGEVDAPALSDTDGVARAHVDVGALSAPTSGWYELAWSVDGGAWSEAAAWSGAAFRLYGAVAADGSDACVSAVSLERGQSLAVRARVVALDGAAGPWSDPTTIVVR